MIESEQDRTFYLKGFTTIDLSESKVGMDCAIA